jgi:hypothetical protein
MSGLPFPQETILGIQPDYKIPYSSNFAVGMTHDFGPGLSARADFVRTRTYDANIGGDTNWIQNADGTFTRKDTRYANMTLVGNSGFTETTGNGDLRRQRDHTETQRNGDSFVQD